MCLVVLQNQPSLCLFSPIGVACGLAMRKSRDVGANFPRKESVVISLENKLVILSHTYTSPYHPKLSPRRVTKAWCILPIR